MALMLPLKQNSNDGDDSEGSSLWLSDIRKQLQASTSQPSIVFTQSSTNLKAIVSSTSTPNLVDSEALRKQMPRRAEKERPNFAKRTEILSLEFPCHEFPLRDYLIRINCPDLAGQFPSRNYRFSPLSTVAEVLRELPMTRALQEKTGGQAVGLYFPCYDSDSDGGWMEETAPLWWYDLGEKVETLEVRPKGSCASLKQGEIAVKVLLPSGLARIMKINVNNTVEVVLQLINSRWKVTRDLKNYGLYLHSQEDGWWLQRDYPLSVYDIGVMEIIELRRVPICELQLYQSPSTSTSLAMISFPVDTRVSEVTRMVIGMIGQWSDEEVELCIERGNSENSRLVWLQHHRPFFDHDVKDGDVLEIRRKHTTESVKLSIRILDANNLSSSSLSPTTSSTTVSPSATSLAPAAVSQPPTRPRSTSASVSRQDGGLLLPLTSSGERKTSAASLTGAYIGGAVPAQFPEDSPRFLNMPAAFPLLAGENLIANIELVLFEPPDSEEDGVLQFTNFRLVFVFNNLHRDPLHVYLPSICRIEKANGYLEIEAKSLQILRLRLPNMLNPSQINELRRRVLGLIAEYAFPEKPTHLFCFQHGAAERDLPKCDGWDVYNADDEYNRMLTQANATQKWRISSVNAGFAMCASYPARLCVPSSISDDTLRPVFGWRSKSRIPVLCYLHHNGAALVRSSQPKPGIKRSRCQEDEQLLQAVVWANPINNQTLALFDARPRMNAMANQAIGAGYENTNHYHFCTNIQFLGIGNIHVMRESLMKLHALCQTAYDWNPEPSNWLTNLDKTEWLYHIKLLLWGAVKVAQTIDKENTSALVHCSDGWDRTTQICSLVQLLLDPFYRTLKGFEILIEKDWVSFGHKFHVRLGHQVFDYQDPNRAPIFVQFLDCVHQLLYQFPCAFEFNERLLLFICDHLYSCQFGTFIFNTEKERAETNLRKSTLSLWSSVNSSPATFTNPFYVACEVIYPDVTSSALRLWSGLFLRWNKRKKEGEVITVEARGWQLKNSCESLYRQLQDQEKRTRRGTPSSAAKPLQK